MGIEYRGGFDLSGLKAKVAEVHDEALKAGAEVVKDRSQEMVPRESEDLADSVEINTVDIGVEIRYPLVYAQYQHERLDLKHADGKNAKFLELALAEKKDGALQAMADKIREAL